MSYAFYMYWDTSGDPVTLSVDEILEQLGDRRLRYLVSLACWGGERDEAGTPYWAALLQDPSNLVGAEGMVSFGAPRATDFPREVDAEYQRAEKAETRRAFQRKGSKPGDEAAMDLLDKARAALLRVLGKAPESEEDAKRYWSLSKSRLASLPSAAGRPVGR
jgi:hypothetical protein